MSDFQLALAQLRGNAGIDYTQLGLYFKLHAWEVSGIPCVQGWTPSSVARPWRCSVALGFCGGGGKSRVHGSSKVLPWSWVALGILSCSLKSWLES